MGEPEEEVMCPLSFLSSHFNFRSYNVLNMSLYLIVHQSINHLSTIYTPVYLGNTVVLLAASIRPAVCTDHRRTSDSDSQHGCTLE